MSYSRVQLARLIDTLKYRYFISEVEVFLSIQPKLDMSGGHDYNYHADYLAGMSPIASAKRAIISVAITRASTALLMEVGR